MSSIPTITFHLVPDDELKRLKADAEVRGGDVKLRDQYRQELSDVRKALIATNQLLAEVRESAQRRQEEAARWLAEIKALLSAKAYEEMRRRVEEVQS